MSKVKQARGKIKSLAEISRIAKRARAQEKKIVTTNGTFDILHAGHVRIFEFAKSQGDILIVGVNSNKSVKAYKGDKRPVVDERDRAELVAALASVDYVFIFNSKTPVPWLPKIRPHVHVKGADWLGVYKGKPYVEEPILYKIGAKFKIFPVIKGRSTTNIIERIKKLSL
ncbi:MAG: pantoate--beta-alanine ligase [bacterium]|nr:pantoate--beta-alanine ligase [bacterium]